MKAYLSNCSDRFSVSLKKDLKNEDELIKEYSAVFSTKPIPYKIFYHENRIVGEKLKFNDEITISHKFIVLISKFYSNQDLKINKCSPPEYIKGEKLKKNCTLFECLDSFTKEEHLDKQNEW